MTDMATLLPGQDPAFRAARLRDLQVTRWLVASMTAICVVFVVLAAARWGTTFGWACLVFVPIFAAVAAIMYVGSRGVARSWREVGLGKVLDVRTGTGLGRNEHRAEQYTILLDAPDPVEGPDRKYVHLSVDADMVDVPIVGPVHLVVYRFNRDGTMGTPALVTTPDGALRWWTPSFSVSKRRRPKPPTPRNT